MTTTTTAERTLDVPAPPEMPDLAAIAAMTDPLQRAIAAEEAHQFFDKQAAAWCRTVRNRSLATKVAEPGMSLAKVLLVLPWGITRQRLHSMVKDASAAESVA